MNRIEQRFAQTAAAGRRSLVLFLTAGYPDIETTERLIPRIADSGCDILELGVPFSDPIADGPTIQAASVEALKGGISLKKILDLVDRVRRAGCEMPILLFGAYNPFLHYGLEALAKRAREVGVDGFLTPDLPIEESAEFEKICRAAGLSMIYLVAPTTTPDRMRRIAEHGSGFLYYISLKGVTGTQITVDDKLRTGVAELRRIAAPLPVAIGFGIQTPQHAAAVAEMAEGVVVGSALIRLIDQYRKDPDLADRVAQFTRALKKAI